MAIFTAAAAWLAGTALAGTFATTALAGALGLAASFGLSYAVKALSGNAPQASAATDHFGVQGALAAGGDVPRSFNLGYSVTAGSLVYANTYGGSTETPNAYLAQVIALADLPGSRLEEIWINGELCTLDLSITQDVGHPVNEYKKDGREYLWIKYYDGTQTEADPHLVSEVSSADRPYPATRVGVGICYVICTSLVEDTLFTGFPSFKFALSGVPLYDPSRDSSVGGVGDQRYDSPLTWGGDGDDLPAVQIYNILRGFYYNGAWLYGLQGMSAARLPADNWIAQIEKCRAPIAGEDGDEPTYRSGGQISVNAQSANAIESLLTACQGRLSEIGGFYKIHLGAPDAPIAALAFSDADILSSEPQTYRPFFALADSVNGIQGTYPDPDQGWNTATAPALYRSDLELLDGGRRLMANPSFDMVPYAAQVQRLQKSAIEEAQRARTHTIVMPPRFWVVEPGDVLPWTSTRNGYAAKALRVDEVVDKANLDIVVSLTEVDPADYDWNHAVDFSAVTRGPSIMVRPAPQGVVDWFAEPWTLEDGAGAPRRPAIRLSWDGTQPGVVGVQYEVRLAADLSDVARGRTDRLSVGSIIVSQGLIPATEYQVRGQYLPSSPRAMLWSDWLSVTTPSVLVGLVEFDAAIAFQVTTALDQLADTAARLEQLAASIASTDIARNWLDKKTVRSELTSVSGAISARIVEESLAASSATSAVAERTLTLETAINDPDAGLSAVSSVVDDLYSQVTNDDTGLSALAGRTLTLETTVNDPDAGVGATAGAVSLLQSQVNLDPDHQTAMSIKLDSLDATVNDEHSGVVASSNAVQELIAQVDLRPGHPSAISGRLGEFSTTIGDHTSSIEELVSSVDGVSVQYGVTGTIDGVVGGFVLQGARRLDGTVGFGLFIRADEVVVDGSIKSRLIDAGQIKAAHIDAAQVKAVHMDADSVTAENGAIKNFAVKTLKIGDNAVTVPKFYQQPGQVACVSFTEITVAATSLNIDTVGLAGKTVTVFAQTFFAIAWAASNPGAIAFRLYINGILKLTWNARNTSTEVGNLSSGLDVLVAGGVNAIAVEIKVTAIGNGTGNSVTPGPTTNLINDANIFALACKR